MKTIKLTEQEFKNIIEKTILKEKLSFTSLSKEYGGETSYNRRFRASIYVDIFIPETDTIEQARKRAKLKADEISESIPNSYVGGVAYFPTGMFPEKKELDRL